MRLGDHSSYPTLPADLLCTARWITLEIGTLILRDPSSKEEKQKFYQIIEDSPQKKIALRV